jgi:hypothetical protein
MGLILKPAHGDDFYASIWNWHPTVELLQRAGLIPEERAKWFHYNCGGSVSADESVQIAIFLEKFLAQLTRHHRLLIDGQTTQEPDTFELFRGEEWHRNYSASCDWLERFRAFCSRSGGFDIL